MGGGGQAKLNKTVLFEGVEKVEPSSIKDGSKFTEFLAPAMRSYTDA